MTVTKVDSALLRSGSNRACCRLRSTLGYSWKPLASTRGSRTDRPKKATDTASKASPIMGENMRISAARRRAPARPDLTSTSGLNASTKRCTNTSMAALAVLRGDADDTRPLDSAGGLLPAVLPELSLELPLLLLLRLYVLLLESSGSSLTAISSSSSSEDTRRIGTVATAVAPLPRALMPALTA